MGVASGPFVRSLPTRRRQWASRQRLHEPRTASKKNLPSASAGAKAGALPSMRVASSPSVRSRRGSRPARPLRQQAGPSSCQPTPLPRAPHTGDPPRRRLPAGRPRSPHRGAGWGASGRAKWGRSARTATSRSSTSGPKGTRARRATCQSSIRRPKGIGLSARGAVLTSRSPKGKCWPRPARRQRERLARLKGPPRRPRRRSPSRGPSRRPRSPSCTCHRPSPRRRHSSCRHRRSSRAHPPRRRQQYRAAGPGAGGHCSRRWSQRQPLLPAPWRRRSRTTCRPRPSPHPSLWMRSGIGALFGGAPKRCPQRTPRSRSSTGHASSSLASFRPRPFPLPSTSRRWRRRRAKRPGPTYAPSSLRTRSASRSGSSAPRTRPSSCPGTRAWWATWCGSASPQSFEARPMCLSCPTPRWRRSSVAPWSRSSAFPSRTCWSKAAPSEPLRWRTSSGVPVSTSRNAMPRSCRTSHARPTTPSIASTGRSWSVTGLAATKRRSP
mmetsp:Transcript_75302/g.207732  ORF Transcript_75302/g.207732 Transcript_75302/m.207732 type:complete len:495 (+) Transcript_75302:568-2052(+)